VPIVYLVSLGIIPVMLCDAGLSAVRFPRLQSWLPQVLPMRGMGPSSLHFEKHVKFITRLKLCNRDAFITSLIYLTLNIELVLSNSFDSCSQA